MERKVSVKKNYIWNTSYQVLTLIVPLITAPYLSRVLRAEGNGIYSYTHSITAYFVLFAVLGTGIFGQRNIAYMRNDRETLSRAFWELFSLRLITSTAALLAYGVFLGFNQEYRIIYLILTMNIVNVILDIAWFYQGIEDFKRIVIRNLIVRVCHTVFIFMFVKEPSDLWLYTASVVGFTALGNLSMWTYLPQYISKAGDINPFRNLKDIILLFLPTIATQVYVILDKSMIGWITNSTYQNGCYEQAEKIARMALTVVTSVAMVVLPRVANLFKEGKTVDAKRYIYKGYRFTLMLSIPIMCGIIGVSNVFVPVFFGAGYDLTKILLPIFSILVVTVSLAYITGYSYLISTKQQNIYTVSVTAAAVCNFVINLFLIPKFGAIGAAAASVSAETIGVTIQIAYCCVTKQLEFRKMFESAWKYILSGLMMLFILIFMQKMIDASLTGLIALIMIGAGSYFVLLLLLQDQFFMDNLKEMMRKLFRFKNR